MACRQCELYAVQLAALTEEVEAWRRREADEAREQLDHDRLARWRWALKFEPQMALLLMTLADARGRVLTREAVDRALRLAPGCWRGADVSGRLLGVVVWKTRRGLKRWPAVAGAIRTERGVGYRMPPPERQALLELVGEGS